MEAVEILRNKFPAVYERFKAGDDDVIRWIVDNIKLLTKDKPPYVVVKESELQEVLPDGTHIYKTANNEST